MTTNTQNEKSDSKSALPSDLNLDLDEESKKKYQEETALLQKKLNKKEEFYKQITEQLVDDTQSIETISDKIAKFDQYKEKKLKKINELLSKSEAEFKDVNDQIEAAKMNTNIHESNIMQFIDLL